MPLINISGPTFRKNLKRVSPPTLNKQKQKMVESPVTDRLELARVKPKKPSFARKLAKFSLTALQLAGSLTGLGVGIGVATNYSVVQEAVQQTNPVYGYARDLKQQQQPSLESPNYVDISATNDDISQLQNHLHVSTTDHSITAVLESDKAQSVLHTVLHSDKVQGALTEELSQLETKINNKLGDIRIKPGEALFEARIPFPTGDGSLLQIAGGDIPVGLRELQMEEIPLVLKHEFDPFDTGLQVDLQPTQVERAPLPTGETTALHLLSARATANNPDLTQTQFSGKIRLELDDGEATRRALEKTQDPARRELLLARLQRIERIQKAVGEQNLEPLLDYALGHRELAFRGNLGGNGQGMGDAKVHAWLTPDQDGDGHAEVKLSAEIATPGLQSVEFTPQSMEHVSTRESGLLGRLQDEISSRIEQKGLEVAPNVLVGLRGTIEGEIRKVLAEELSKGQMEVDALLDGTLDVVNQSTQGVGLELTRIDVQPGTGNLVGGLRSDDTLKNTLGPRATVRKQTESQVEVLAPELLPLVAISNPDSTLIRVESNKPSIVIPGANARRFLSAVLANPETQQAFENLTLGPRQQITEKAASLPELNGSLYVDVEVPFPAAESLQSPLGPIPKLMTKEIPVRADYNVKEFGLDLQLDARLVDVDEAARPTSAAEDGVFIGAISVATKPFTTTLEGTVAVHKQDSEGGAAWAEEALDEAFQGQDFEFETEVSLGETKAVFYLWLTPDSNGDGRADVAIGHRTLNTGSGAVDVNVNSVTSAQGNLDLSTRLGGRLNGIVNEVVSNQIASSGENLQMAISKLLESKVDGLLGQGSEKVAEAVNGKLPGFYNKLSEIEVGLPENLIPAGKVDLGLRELEVKGDSLVLNYGNQRLEQLLAGTPTPTISTQQAESGELLVSVPGALFNRLVADKRDGGPMDWDPLLNEILDGSGVVKSMRLATNKQGDVISPELKIVNGNPVLSLSVDAQTNGLGTPVTAGARKLPGFLGDGLGWLTENTVGAVLGSRLRTEVQVPLEFTIQDGVLQVSAGDASFVEPHEKGKRSLADFVPTRALSGVVTRGLANSLGPKALNKFLSDITPKVNPSQYGLDWSRIEIQASENGGPVITVGVKANDVLPSLLLAK